MKNLTSILVAFAVAYPSCASVFAQTKVTQLVIANSNGNFKLNGPTVPASGSKSFDFPASPTGSKFVMSSSTGGQTISGDVTFTGPVTFGDELSLTFGGSMGSAGDVLTSDGFGGASWQTPSGGGGGGGVPTTRTFTTTSPLRIGGGASADLSADRTLSIDFSVANEWTGSQTFPQTTTQGNLLINSINAGDQAIGVARGGTGKTSLTANRVLLGNGTSAVAEVGAGNNGEVLTLVSGVPTWKPATSEVTMTLGTTITTTSATLDSVPGLSFTIAANEVWEFEYLLKLGSSGNGLTFAFNAPSGNTTGILTATSGSISGSLPSTIRMTDNNSSTTVCVSSSTDLKHFAIIRGFVSAGGTGGVFQLRWARPSGTGTMYPGSRVTARKAS